MPDKKLEIKCRRCDAVLPNDSFWLQNGSVIVHVQPCPKCCVTTKACLMAKEIVVEYLTLNHYDGLVNAELKCSCGITNLAPLSACKMIKCSAGYLSKNKDFQK